MKPLHRRRPWPVLASIAAAAALASIAGEPDRSLDGARGPALVNTAAPAVAPAIVPAATPEPAALAAPSPRAHGVEPAHATPGLARTAAKQGAAAPPPASNAPPEMGRIIALDPETGQLGAPSPEQVEALRTAAGIAAVSRTDEGLVETRLTDGTVILDLGGRFQDHAVARLDRNGRLIYECVHDDGTPPTAPRDTVPRSALEER